MATFTQEQFDNITAAIAEGALTVKYSDKEVTYKSLDDMIRIRSMIAKDLGLACKDDGQRFARITSGLKSPDANSQRYGTF